MPADEVRKGDFVYRDTFFADPGSNRHHPRASIAELRDLLLPKRGQGTPKDQVAHWYEAQLLHYGLPRTRDKNAAKVRLTSAIAAGSLVVPPHIARLEAEMKKGFITKSRNAKAAVKREQAMNLPQEPMSKGMKRKVEANDQHVAAASRTKVSVTVGNVTFDIDHHEDAGDGAKKRKFTQLPAQANASKSTKSWEKEEAFDTAPKQSTTTADATTASRLPKNLVTAHSRQWLSNGHNTPKARQTTQRWTSTPISNSSPKRQTAKRNGPPANVLSTRAPNFSPAINERSPLHILDDQSDDDAVMRDNDHDDPPPYDSLDFDHVPINTNRLQASGIYTISTRFAPTSEYNYDDNGDIYSELTLIKDRQTGQFWARFHVANYDGVFHIADTRGIATRQAVAFHWRAQDLNSGQFRFRRDQDGWIQLDGSGGIRGRWHDLLSHGDGGDADLEFRGQWDRGLDGDVEVEELMDQWEWFVKSAYGRY